MRAPEPGHSRLIDPGHNRIKVKVKVATVRGRLSYTYSVVGKGALSVIIHNKYTVVHNVHINIV